MTEVFTFPGIILSKVDLQKEECPLAKLHGNQLQLNVEAINTDKMLKWGIIPGSLWSVL